jgi:F-type H+-transporting ATPase subunit beta
VENQGIEELESEEDRTVARRARYLNEYLAQPFSTAEPWTGLLGEYSPLPDTLAQVEAILAGKHDNDEHQGAIRIG